MVCFAPSNVVASIFEPSVCGIPCQTNTSASTMEIGSSTYNVQRVRSTQKFPSVRAERRLKPRINASASAMPVAAETKLCTVSPAICTRLLIVLSGT